MEGFTALSIEGSGQPVVFKARSSSAEQSSVMCGSVPDTVTLETHVRSLQGMQKEALIRVGPGGTVWHMVSDEGPYLNGTDLAPFPLAYFAAGMQFSFLSQLLRVASTLGIEIQSLELVQDNWYAMNGSFLRGDAMGSAMPPDLHVRIETECSSETTARLVKQAEAACPVQALMRNSLKNTFSLSLDGRPLDVSNVRPSPTSRSAEMVQPFDGIEPDTDDHFLADIITKQSTAERVFRVEGGAGSSLKSEQHRTLHIHGKAKVGEARLLETVVELRSPIGSTFRFLCDEVPEQGGAGMAPPPLAYTAAGIGFCFMTQLGRYAHIVKQPLRSYRIEQRNVFRLGGAAEHGSAEPVDTRVFIQMEGSEETAVRFVSVGERTCFLHAAMRGSHPCSLTAKLNGESLLLA